MTNTKLVPYGTIIRATSGEQEAVWSMEAMMIEKILVKTCRHDCLQAFNFLINRAPNLLRK